MSFLRSSLLLLNLSYNLSLPVRLSAMKTRRSVSLATSSVRVTSYNVLSTQLGGADYYTKCDAKWLDPMYRISKLKQKLESEIEDKAVICLQEVSHQCSNMLHPFFSSNGYYFTTAQYGNKFNGYMGVGIAIPLDKYQIDEVSTTRVADTKKMPRQPKLHAVIAFLQAYILTPIVAFITKIGILKKVFKPFEDALYRHNQMLSVRLKPLSGFNSGQSFVVGTYHMPCMFNYPAVMSIHCALSTQLIEKFAGTDPYVYCGDFNIKPVDSMYTLLTTGDMPVGDPARPINEPGDQWSPKVTPMRSAYKEWHGQEPAFTNWAQVKQEEPFKDTLDYIFLSPQWTVLGTGPLPNESISGPFPTEHEPSDHLLISADLSLISKK